MSNLSGLADFLNAALYAFRFEEEANSIYHPSEREVSRLGLALEPSADIGEWVRIEFLDALFLHRPWGLDKTTLPKGVGVLAYHLAFDEALTLGYNPRLAEILGMRGLEPLGFKEERPIGMIGDVSPTSSVYVHNLTKEIFGGLERAHEGTRVEVSRVAVIGAMNPALIREAAARGAGVYLTGQYRKSAQKAVEETGLGVLETGHARSERWGLRALGHLLSERFCGLEVVLRA